MTARPITTTYLLEWPRLSDERALTAFFRSLAGEATRGPVTLEASSDSGQINHSLTLPTSRADATLRRLALAVPGVRATVWFEKPLEVHRALRLRLSSRRRALRSDHPSEISLALLSALAGTKPGELLLLQWTLGPRMRAVAIPNQFVSFSHESWFGNGVSAPFTAPRPVDPELRSAIRGKQSLAGWRAIGRIAVRADNDARERQLLHELLAALRVAEAPGLRLEARPTSAGSVVERRKPWIWPGAINEAEIVGLSAWPIGETTIPGLSRSAFALMPATKTVPRRGRIVGDSNYPGDERPVAIGGQDALRHTYLLGPTGVGKSTVIAHLALADARDGPQSRRCGSERRSDR